MADDDPLTDSLMDIVDAMDSQRGQLSSTLATARGYLTAGVDGWPCDLAQPVQDDIVPNVAADLWSARRVRNGLMAIGTEDGPQAYRVSSDPLRSAWPKLRSAGIMRGMGIA